MAKQTRPSAKNEVAATPESTTKTTSPKKFPPPPAPTGKPPGRQPVAPKGSA